MSISCGPSATAPANIVAGSSEPGTGSNIVSASLSGTDAMFAQPSGQQASQYATEMGMNPSVPSGGFQIESNCQNVTGPGTPNGLSQLSDGTYNQSIQQAVAQNPSLAGAVSGKTDPATESIAAAQYLRNGATSLEARGIANPTGHDVRTYYNFGPSAGANVASPLSSPERKLLRCAIAFNMATGAAAYHQLVADFVLPELPARLGTKLIGGFNSTSVQVGVAAFDNIWNSAYVAGSAVEGHLSSWGDIGLHLLVFFHWVVSGAVVAIAFGAWLFAYVALVPLVRIGPVFVACVAFRRCTASSRAGLARPYHEAVITVASSFDVRVFVVEMGYLRPDSITQGRDGMSSNSRVLSVPSVILEAAADWKSRIPRVILITGLSRKR